ncbi:hypothetical protein IFM89_008376 [Coptis chinensis]|uniref:Uncharacterized protein n=1 Tax=Coptis chinensis TaxID=261450 RepID=A0A835IM16_9MAGN|nr:hypothetical protein IFM89_008376 [Coptis chinensis]
MSFSFFKALRGKAPLELVKAIRGSLLALDTKTVAEVKALKKALEEVEKNFLSMRQLLYGDGEVGPNLEHVSQFTIKICKEDVIGFFIHKLPILGWEWCIYANYCDFLNNYDNKDVALNCGNMLRKCIKFPSLAK